MATVVDKSGNSPANGTDQKLEHPNRTNSGSPQGSLAPQYAGEIVHDTTNNDIYRAYGLSNSDWERIRRD